MRFRSAIFNPAIRICPNLVIYLYADTKSPRHTYTCINKGILNLVVNVRCSKMVLRSKRGFSERNCWFIVSIYHLLMCMCFVVSERYSKLPVW